MKVNQSSPASEEESTSNDMAASTSTSSSTRRAKTEFPIKLFAMLELAENLLEFSQAVTWLPHGRAFRILNKVKFMEEVVPLFFNQTKIRSFNRQLYLWGFRRIGRGDDQVWYHDNFLRGVPESMEHMVRTKVKGNSNSTVDSGDDGRAPNFDNLPPLPACNKQPSAVVDEMEEVILKLHSSPGVIAHHNLMMAPLSCPKPTNLNGNGATNHHLTVLPRSETPCEFSVNYNQNQSLLLTCPPLFPRRVSNESQWYRPCFLQLQANTIESTTYTNETSDLCCSPLVHNNNDFEPLSFRDDDELCDDFANFIQGAIQLVEG